MISWKCLREFHQRIHWHRSGIHVDGGSSESTADVMLAERIGHEVDEVSLQEAWKIGFWWSGGYNRDFVARNWSTYLHLGELILSSESPQTPKLTNGQNFRG